MPWNGNAAIPPIVGTVHSKARTDSDPTDLRCQNNAMEAFAEKLRRSATSEIFVKMSGDERILGRIVAEEAAGGLRAPD